MENYLHEMLRISDEKVRYDSASKLLLSQKPILAWILHDCVPEYAGCTPKEIEKFLHDPLVSAVAVGVDETAPSFHSISKEDVSLSEGKVFYDIYFLAGIPGSDDEIGLIINVEAQNRSRPGYPLTRRAVYYASRMLSSQFGVLGESTDYGWLRKIYSIWICTNAKAESERNSIVEYRIGKRDIIGHVAEDERNYDLLHIVMLNLGDVEGTGGILRLLNSIMSEELSLSSKEEVLTEYEIPMTTEVQGGLNNMCNLSEGIYQKGIDKGHAQGLEQGLAQGLEQGLEQGEVKSTAACIRNAMKSFHISLEGAMDGLKVPDELRPAVLRELDMEGC